MNKINVAIAIMFASQNVWAVTDQIKYADKYYVNKAGVALLQGDFGNVYNIINKNLLSDPQDVIVDKTVEGADFVSPYKALELGTDIYPGAKHKNIIPLQKQWGLEETGVYSQAMVKKVKKIQSKAGFSPTGIIDKNTWFSIYEQPEDWKIKVVSQAKENWRSILEKHSKHPNDKMIIINIPSMKLYLYERGEDDYTLLMESRVVIGKKKTQTPLDDFELISLKYNPNWTPTKNILKRNLYKDGTLNVKWLVDHEIVLTDENGVQRPYEDLPLIKQPKFIQPSGDGNALGNLKFETSSKQDIYLHDTNERNLFEYNTRTYSSGCVRVQEYVSLAAYISEKEEEDIQENIDKKNMFYERVPKRVPVYFDYSQVRFFNEKKMVFFSDVYSKNVEAQK